MKLIPILFSTPMVQAILSGDKSMTRRTKGLDKINKTPNEFRFDGADIADDYSRSWKSVWFEGLIDGKPTEKYSQIKNPYGQPGDVLWVREKFCIIKPEIDYEFVYFTEEDYDPKECKWKPNIHMPFAACRIFLRVKEIRVERLQDIKTKDIAREGVQSTYTNPKMGARHENAMYIQFQTLWININGADSWNANPWVWVIAFERVTAEKEIAEIRKLWSERRAK